MQDEDKRPPSSGRPSLLSKEPAAATGSRSSILDGLEQRPPAPRTAVKAAGSARNRMRAAVGVLAVAVIGAGVLIWRLLTPEPTLSLPQAASTAPAAPAVATAPQEPAPVAPAPAATIVEETAAVSPPADTSRSIKEMLNDTPAKPQRDELAAAFEHPPQHKATEHKKVDKPAKKPVQVAKKVDPVKKQQDSDVVLLSALVAHVQATRPAKETSTPGYQLKQCSRQNEAGAAQCRAHLCSTTARNEPECKQQPVAVKTASES